MNSNNAVGFNCPHKQRSICFPLSRVLYRNTKCALVLQAHSTFKIHENTSALERIPRDDEKSHKYSHLNHTHSQRVTSVQCTVLFALRITLKMWNVNVKAIYTSNRQKIDQFCSYKHMFKKILMLWCSVQHYIILHYIQYIPFYFKNIHKTNKD